MKTAEEIVNNCPSVKIGIDDFYGKQTFIKAIEQAQKEALRWRDPKEELPSEGEEVQLKIFNKYYNKQEYTHDVYLGDRWRFWGSEYIDVLGWRPIE